MVDEQDIFAGRDGVGHQCGCDDGLARACRRNQQRPANPTGNFTFELIDCIELVGPELWPLRIWYRRATYRLSARTIHTRPVRGRRGGEGDSFGHSLTRRFV